MGRKFERSGWEDKCYRKRDWGKNKHAAKKLVPFFIEKETSETVENDN